MAWARPTAWSSRRLAGDGLDEGQHPGVVQSGQIDARDAVQATEGAERLHQGIGLRELTVPKGPEHEQAACRIGRGQVPEEEEAALVGPLEVVEHHHDGLVLGGRGQQSHHGGEEEEALGVGVGGLRRGQRQECGRTRAGTSRASSDPWASTWARSCSSGAWVT